MVSFGERSNRDICAQFSIYFKSAHIYNIRTIIKNYKNDYYLFLSSMSLFNKQTKLFVILDNTYLYLYNRSVAVFE